MADYDKEIPFGDGVDNRGVDDGDAIEMQNLDPYDSSSRRGSVDITAPPTALIKKLHLQQVGAKGSRC